MFYTFYNFVAQLFFGSYVLTESQINIVTIICYIICAMIFLFVIQLFIKLFGWVFRI